MNWCKNQLTCLAGFMTICVGLLITIPLQDRENVGVGTCKGVEGVCG